MVRRMPEAGTFDDATQSFVVKVTENWIVSVAPMGFNHRVLLTAHQTWPHTYTAGWCYDSNLAAAAAAAVFDPETDRDPVGYKKVAVDHRHELLRCGGCSQQAYDSPPDCGQRFCPAQQAPAPASST